VILSKAAPYRRLFAAQSHVFTEDIVLERFIITLAYLHQVKSAASNMNKKIKFAIIGCGKVSPKHAESLKSIPSAELTAVCDKNEDRAKSFAKKYNCRHYADYNELLKKEKDADCVIVCTPHAHHAEITISSANAGKHVVTEKPMAMNLEEADKMIAACKKNNVKLFVVKQNRYNEPIKRLKDAINQGRFGKIFYGNTTVYWSRPQEYYDEDPWRGTKADGGVLMNQASHHVDMLRWLMGDVESIKATTGTLTHKIESEDTGLVILKFRNGALGTIVATTCVFPHNLEGSVTIMGTKGTVKVGGVALNKIDIWNFEDWNNDDEAIKTSQNPPNVHAFGHLEYLKEVVESIENDTPPKVDGVEGRKTLELINNIYKSAKFNKEICL